ncbi:MFS transporter [Sphingobium baderi]|uniref:Major facilitator superfamily (MFS) profile domain-containing protein n=1 Tax=Sphingobium baderi TaxID=1332080 RepID=A0A0S3EYC5_9SPHN|nr:MFS transporter [Sphingobium baderi]ALR20406.1 hypothetical protein ATN00_08880 [Sphingobium baderi]
MATSSIDAPIAEQGTAVAKTVRRTVPLFLLCYIIAQADKQAFGLTVAAIQQDIHITDTQIGLLQGAVFAIAFSLGGLPMGWLVDRRNRVHIAAICLTIWSIATALSGLAHSFEALVMCRGVTAFFEAGLAPAAFSLFSDRIGAGQAARASAIYMLAPFLGAGVAMIGGAGVGQLLPHWPLAAQFGYDGTWRLIFLMIGAPGVLLGVLLPLLLRDTRRRAPVRRAGDAAIPAWAPVFGALFARRGFLMSYQLGMAMFVAFLSIYVAWFPTYLIRGFDLGLAGTGAMAGATYMIGGVAGTVFTIASMKTRRDLSQVVGWLARSIALLVPIAVLLPLVPWIWAIIPIYAAFAFLTATVLAVMIVPLQLALPLDMQGRAIGVFTLIVTGVAGSLGPLLTGWITHSWGLQLGSTMFALGSFCIVGATLLMRNATVAMDRTVR